MQQSSINRFPKRNSIFSFEKQKSNFLNSQQVARRKSILSNINSLNDRNKSNTDVPMINKAVSKSLFIPKTQLRVIKVPGFCNDFICKKNTIKTIKQVHENYKEIQFLLDIVHYLKSENELNIIGKFFFSEEQRKILSYTYSFEADFRMEREGYDYMIKHEKNKFDEKELKETSQKSLLEI